MQAVLPQASAAVLPAPDTAAVENICIIEFVSCGLAALPPPPCLSYSLFYSHFPYGSCCPGFVTTSEFSFCVTLGPLPDCGQLTILTLAVSGDSNLITLTTISRSICRVIYLARFSHRSAYGNDGNNNYSYYLLLISKSAGLC